MSKGAQFPGAEMTGEKKDSSTARHSSLIVLKPVIDYDLFYVFAVQLGELRELAEQTSHIKKNSLHNRHAFGRAKFGHRQLQVPPTYAPQSSMKMVGSSGNQPANSERKP